MSKRWLKKTSGMTTRDILILAGALKQFISQQAYESSLSKRVNILQGMGLSFLPVDQSAEKKPRPT